MKIAVVSNNEKTISKHFGRAKHYIVFTIDEKKITGSQLIEKKVFHSGSHNHHEHGQGHGQHQHGQGHKRHAEMIAPIADCNVLITGGMGQKAYNKFSTATMQVYLTDQQSPEEAVRSYLEGKLTNRTDLLH